MAELEGAAHIEVQVAGRQDTDNEEVGVRSPVVVGGRNIVVDLEGPQDQVVGHVRHRA